MRAHPHFCIGKLRKNRKIIFYKIFEENSLAGVVGFSESKTAAGSTQEKNLAQAATRDNSSPDAVVVNSTEATAMASRYRERIYAEPESLAKAVKVNAVSNENGIYGYRVAPGTDAKAFETLGFQSLSTLSIPIKNSWRPTSSEE